jgi:Protein of unknown function (DUF2786)
MSDTTEEPGRKAMVARIRALMQRTVANGCTEAEAKAAAEKVDALMGIYEIDLTETLVGEQEVVMFEIKLDHHPVRHAALKIAAFCDCKLWAANGMITFLGLEIDTEIAEYMTLMFQRAIDREAGQYTVFNEDLALAGPTVAAQMVHSFSVGMASRLGDRLSMMKSSRDFNQRTTGFDLVAAKKPLIDEAFATLGFTLEPGGSGGSIRHHGAYNAGRAAADGVAITPGVNGKASSTGRIR